MPMVISMSHRLTPIPGVSHRLSRCKERGGFTIRADRIVLNIQDDELIIWAVWCQKMLHVGSGGIRI
jgi:hypothetical protein